MDLVGKRFRPLPNSKRYGPKKWIENSEGVFCEVEMTPLDHLEHDLAGGDFFDSTALITESDAEKYPAVKDYVGGRAIFPKVAGFDVSTPEGKKKQRAAEDAWSLRACQMHDAQVPVTVADKPEDGGSTGKYFRELKRGD